MILGLLPWERLPAYIVGPLVCALNIWLLFAEESPAKLHLFFEVGGIAFGVWVIWRRFDTAVEPLWDEKRRAAALHRQGESE